MGNLAKLKVAVGQPELSQGSLRHNEAVQDRMMALAVEAGADLLVLPGSLSDESAIHLIALNDTRIDVAGNVVIVEAAGESYQIGLGAQPQGCDFSVFVDVQPWAMKQHQRPSWPGIVLRPVGMRNADKKVFAYDGGTAVYSNEGHLLARLRDDFEEDFALVTLDRPGSVAEPCKDKVLAALVKTIRRFDSQVLGWEPRWVVGLSGGLDSSITAALLVLALGPQRVVGCNLPSRFSSDATIANARYIAEALDIPLKSGSIEGLVEATGQAVGQLGYPSSALEGLVAENLQARSRGQLLSVCAALEDGVVVNNGNRVEAAFGYATLYGDAIGALAPIGDLLKTQLFDLARTINGEPGCEIIPANLLPTETSEGFEWATMPSAELSEGQRDPMKWFYHDWLLEQLLDGQGVDAGACAVLGHYLDGSLLAGPMGKWIRFYGLDTPRDFLADLEWVMEAIRASAFKRIQSPPFIALASMASILSPPEEQGTREPSERFMELRARVLKR